MIPAGSCRIIHDSFCGGNRILQQLSRRDRNQCCGTCCHMSVFHSDNDAETEKLGQRLAAALGGGDVVALYGDLGAGKTVFARGLARGLGIDEPVTSPTFALVQEYQGESLRFCHIDLYRLDSPENVIGIGIDEYLDDAGAVTVIEWAERLGNLCPENPIQVYITVIDGTRRIEITGAADFDVAAGSRD